VSAAHGLDNVPSNRARLAGRARSADRTGRPLARFAGRERFLSRAGPRGGAREACTSLRWTNVSDRTPSRPLLRIFFPTTHRHPQSLLGWAWSACKSPNITAYHAPREASMNVIGGIPRRTHSPQAEGAEAAGGCWLAHAPLKRPPRSGDITCARATPIQQPGLESRPPRRPNRKRC